MSVGESRAAQGSSADGEIVRGSLEELRALRSIALVVNKSSVIDARDMSKALIEAAYKAGEQQGPRRRFNYAYATVARQINRYIQKYGGMTAAERFSDADYIIFFNLLEYRRTINGLYPYGELYIILPEKPGSSSPARIVWRSKGATWAEDATKDFIKALKQVRGES